MLRSIVARLGRAVGLAKNGVPPLQPTAAELRLIARIRERKLTYLSDRKLASLVTTCRAIEESDLPGIFLEAGCALGGSAILLASTKRRERPFNVYDVFGMIPPPTQDDTQDVHERYQAIVQGQSKGIDGDPYYGYIEDLYEVELKLGRHREIADEVIYTGDNAHRSRASQADHDSGRFIELRSAKEVSDQIKQTAVPGELILLKSSSNLHLERIALAWTHDVKCWIPVCGKSESCQMCGLYEVPFEEHSDFLAKRKLARRRHRFRWLLGG